MNHTFQLRSEALPCPPLEKNVTSECTRDNGTEESDELLNPKTSRDPENCKTSNNAKVWYKRRIAYVGIPIILLILTSLIVSLLLWTNSGKHLDNISSTTEEGESDFVSNVAHFTAPDITKDSHSVGPSTSPDTYPDMEKPFEVSINEQNGIYRYKVIPKNSNKYGNSRGLSFT